MPVNLRRSHDPNKHPRYPKGAVVDGKNVGGKFMPKDGKQSAIGRNKPVRAIAAKIAQKGKIKAQDANRRLMNAVARELKAHRANGGDDDQKTLRRVAQKAIAKEVKRITEGKPELGRDRKGKKPQIPSKSGSLFKEFDLEDYPPPPSTSTLSRKPFNEYNRKISEIDKRNYGKAIAEGQRIANPLEKDLEKYDKKYGGLLEKSKANRDKLRAEIEQYQNKGETPPPELESKYTRADIALFSLVKRQEREKLGVVKAFRRQLFLSHQLSQEEVDNFTESLDLSKRQPVKRGLPEGFTESDLIDSVSVFYRLVGGKLSSLKKLKYSEKRAYASQQEQSINIGKSETSGKLLRSLCHELGHHVEYSDPRIKMLANEFLLSRTNGTIKKLKELTKDKRYSDDEIAYEGQYLHPYVGKKYPNRSTEVVSMGMELFSDAGGMLHLLQKDPEHFYLMLAIARLKKK